MADVAAPPARGIGLRGPGIQVPQPQHAGIFFAGQHARRPELAGTRRRSSRARRRYPAPVAAARRPVRPCDVRPRTGTRSRVGSILMPSISKVGAPHCVGTSLISEPEIARHRRETVAVPVVDGAVLERRRPRVQCRAVQVKPAAVSTDCADTSAPDPASIHTGAAPCSQCLQHAAHECQPSAAVRGPAPVNEIPWRPGISPAAASGWRRRPISVLRRYLPFTMMVGVESTWPCST